MISIRETINWVLIIKFRRNEDVFWLSEILSGYSSKIRRIFKLKNEKSFCSGATYLIRRRFKLETVSIIVIVLRCCKWDISLSRDQHMLSMYLKTYDSFLVKIKTMQQINNKNIEFKWNKKKFKNLIPIQINFDHHFIPYSISVICFCFGLQMHCI